MPLADAARSEHDGFTVALREAGVIVHLFSDLLAETLTVPEAKAAVLEAVVDERACGTVAAASLSEMLAAMDAAELTAVLIGGITKREVADRVAVPGSLWLADLDDGDFVLPPLPNHLYSRDASAWIYGGVAINSMRKRARNARPSATRPSTAGIPASQPPASHTGPPVENPGSRPPKAVTSSSSATGRS